MAYLIPAALWALQNHTRVVISTNTINLQDQLINKDIPDICTALDLPLRATVLKGRANYLCPRRLESMRRRGPENADEMRILAKVLVWLQETRTGDRQELNLNRSAERMVWERLSAADEGCTSETCLRRMGGACPFYRARQAAQYAHLIIVNHALLLADVATGSRVLPDYDYLIVDEAHHMEDAVTNALSFQVTQYDVERITRELGSPKAGILGRLLTLAQDVVPPQTFATLDHLAQHATDLAFRFQNEARNFFIAIEEFLYDQREGRDLGPYAQQVRILPATRTLPTWMDVEIGWEAAESTLKSLKKTLEDLGQLLAEMMEGGVEALEDEFSNLSNIYRRLVELEDNLGGLVFQPDAQRVYWAEVASDGRGYRFVLHRCTSAH
jgi:DNA polymerase-3 subunit epsilon/ATP-dependent DNA helicase DinG